MPSRRSLSDALTLTPEQAAFIDHGPRCDRGGKSPASPPETPESDTKSWPTKPAAKHSPKRATQKPPAKEDPSAQALDQTLVPLTTRIRRKTLRLLTEAHLRQKLDGRRPSTLQDIIEDALEGWLRSNKYLRPRS
jgi:hypothetical protein